MDYIVITAANDKYINTIIDFINNYPLEYSTLILYDIGFNKDNEEKIILLKDKYKFEFKKFDFNNYPDHVNLNKYYGLECSYAYKPIILYNEAILIENKNKIIIGMDSANRFSKEAVMNIYNLTKKQGIYSPISNDANTIESIELNNHNVVKQYGLTQDEHYYKLKSISGNLVGFDYMSNIGLTILNQWYKDSLNKNLISPDGTNRNNNRQDQTILSLLIYLYEKNNNVSLEYPNFDVKFWNKNDESTIDKDLKPYRLIQQLGDRIYQLAIIYCKTLDDAIKIYANRKDILETELLKKFRVEEI